ncbi:MAG: class I SAM-dependent methyltransferase [Rhodospirillaceae bacterium]|jgi:demethylmenaquinone methyltransferase/2-methoxy-6-polyprenyl-1,4-benzoquinol methylase|nr:class I SAM-dependent methyltransferase [Rhodospirillaceae bacterium]MBT3490860.1 class I SAM-dependent methyltransferase [Rhodospirillaceae bacterium]MBT3778695.1 class I SAM-dependent methyltransferase [Rhodospirillaceae bacterium]MBT3976646.1 class I SAM-dependent methyltransferase [Rhodospirillaceae bacterium]MBT4171190.1 class I SAM-dependent methyltransferase [Rhodospirillaceae bacterium]
MDALNLGKSRLINMLVKLPGKNMESRLRRWFHDPEKLLSGANISLGQTVLEVGCGTGFFTLTAAEIIGETGHLIALDPVSGYVERVEEKVRQAGLENVEVVRRDALATGLEAESVDVALLFGVLPFPTLPLDQLLPEMHRVLKPSGTLAVWLFPVSYGVPAWILQSGLFTDLGRQEGVFRYQRSGHPL